MSTECSQPFQCGVIHELKAEFADVKAELRNLNDTVRSLIEAFVNNAAILPETSEFREQEISNNQTFVEQSLNSELNSILPQEESNLSQLFDNPLQNSEFSDLVKIEPLDIESLEFDIPECSKSEVTNENEADKKNERKQEICHSKVTLSKQIKRSPNKAKTATHFCKKCKIRIASNNWTSHIIHNHFTKRALTCRLCGYEEKWRVGQMKRHFEKRHKGEELKFISKKEDLIAEIKKIGNDLRKLEPKRTTVNNKGSNNHFYCKECGAWVLTKGWCSHVAVTHYTKSALICSLCGFEEKWFTSHMKKHFNNNHPGEQVKFMDKRDQLKPILRKIGDAIKMTLAQKCGQLDK